jgi:ribonucleoside-diphosphate reductase alpha chain
MAEKLVKIIKRNGELVDFDRDKIQRALKKAFAHVEQKIGDDDLTMIVDHVVVHLEHQVKSSGKTPKVEDVQDTVERVLMEKGFYQVAKAYIVYRYEHQKKREAQKQTIQEKIDKDALYIVKRSGQREVFSMNKLLQSLEWVIGGVENEVDIQMIAEQCRAEVYDGISTEDLDRVLIMTTRSMIERDPAYSKVAARLAVRRLYKEVIGPDYDRSKLEKQYQQAFIDNIKKAVEIERMDARLLDFNLEAMSKKLVIDRDDLFDYLGAEVLYDKYYVYIPETKQRLETPQAFWMRVAMGLALEEENKEARAEEFYEIMSTLRYVPSTPTLVHSGTCHPQLSSCYLTTVQDSLTNIFKSLGDNAQLSKWAGGLGNDWTNIRGTGALIKGTGVGSQGVVPFLKIANDTTVAINRSGRRRGATCAYLETWHFDIEDFLELRRNTGDERRRTHDMNIANWIPDLFMKRVREDGQWTLFSTDEVPDLHHIYGRQFEERYTFYEQEAAAGRIRLFKTIRARDLWRKMISMLFETGHPWITFKDPCNLRSPQDHVGVVHSSNLCTEITLNTSADETAVCNLGSLNLDRFMKDGKMDEELLKQTIFIAMRSLDNVVDINFYPTEDAKRSNMKHRPVGIGIRGFQDVLFMQDINFDSEEAVQFADKNMEMISYYTILASTMLAEERGSYQTFKGSKWDRGILPVDTLDVLEQERRITIPVSREARMDWDFIRERIKKFGMRNSNTMAMAPTATTANISGCFPTIEPIYKNLYVKSNMFGEFTIVNKYLVADLKKLNLWGIPMLNEIKQHNGDIGHINTIPQNLKDKYKGVFEIDPKHLVKVAAYRGKWIDQSQSYNVFYQGSSGRELAEIYMYAWELGMKTTYYLRTLAASSVEKSTVALGKDANKSAASQSQQKPVVETKIVDTVVAAAPVAPVTVNLQAATPEPVSVMKTPAACRIDDPECESCGG